MTFFSINKSRDKSNKIFSSSKRWEADAADFEAVITTASSKFEFEPRGLSDFHIGASKTTKLLLAERFLVISAASANNF